MQSIARFLVRRTRVVLAVTLLVTLAAVAMLPRLSFDVDVASFLLQSTPEGRTLVELQEKYDAGDPITVLLTRTDGGAFTDREGLVLLAQARDALTALDAVASVGSLVPVARSARASNTSSGNRCSSSISCAMGAISDSQKSRTVSRIIRCSAGTSKSMGKNCDARA
jgi:predicted RND superfamily exporter protein